MISRASIRTKAKAYAQDAGPGTSAVGVQLLLNLADYDLGILQALQIYAVDRPLERVVDHTLAAAGFRLALAGTGALSSLSGANAWVDGKSTLRAVYLPWEVATQGQAPLDENTWRVVRDPAAIVLELLDRSAAVGQVLRLVFTGVHALTEAPNAVSAPTAAPTATVASQGPGNVTTGTHSYVYTWVTAHGETTPSPASSVVTVVDASTQGQVQLTLPTSAEPGVTAARVYRTVAGDAGSRLLVGEFAIAGHSLTGITVYDNVADGSLGAAAPATNTAGGANTVPDGDEEALAILTGSVYLQLAAVKAAQNTGNTGLPNDIVDRRTQSDIFRSRAKELREHYNVLVGKGPSADLAPASATKDLDVPDRWGVGRLWASAGVR